MTSDSDRSNRRGVYVDSEFGQLRRVIIHRPDPGLGLITPSKAQEWLFEDIVDLSKMQKEHDQFTKVMSLLGVEMLELQDLLSEILDSNFVEDGGLSREQLVTAICTQEECPYEIHRKLLEMSGEDLALTLISGTFRGEEKCQPIFPPIPNLVFTRDIGAVVKDKIVLSKAAKIPRRRESLISKYVFYRHPEFKDIDKIELANDQGYFLLGEKEKEAYKVTIEGGDIIVINDEHILIGCGERTTARAFEKLNHLLLGTKTIRKITRVIMPEQRSSMHLDTILSFVSSNTIVAFLPMVCEKNDGMNITQYTRVGEGNQSREFQSLKELFLQQQDVQFIPCGEGVFPHDEREQWQDAANLLAINENVCIGYDRNHKTIEAMRDAGITPVEAQKLIKDIEDGTINPEEFLREKHIITIPSSELCRARGGSHCMTLPLLRNPI